MSKAEEKWRRWQQFVEGDSDKSADTDEEVQFGPLVETRLENIEENIEEEIGNMAAQVDIAALLAQLTAANLAIAQWDMDRDAWAVASVAAREREDGILSATATANPAGVSGSSSGKDIERKSC